MTPFGDARTGHARRHARPPPQASLRSCRSTAGGSRWARYCAIRSPAICSAVTRPRRGARRRRPAPAQQAPSPYRPAFGRRAGHHRAGRRAVESPSRRSPRRQLERRHYRGARETREIWVVREPDHGRAHCRSEDHRMHATTEQAPAPAARLVDAGSSTSARCPPWRLIREHGPQGVVGFVAHRIARQEDRRRRHPSDHPIEDSGDQIEEAFAVRPSLRIGSPRRRANCAGRAAARGGNQRRNATPRSGRPSSGTPAAREDARRPRCWP